MQPGLPTHLHGLFLVRAQPSLGPEPATAPPSEPYLLSVPPTHAQTHRTGRSSISPALSDRRAPSQFWPPLCFSSCRLSDFYSKSPVFWPRRLWFPPEQS